MPMAVTCICASRTAGVRSWVFRYKQNGKVYEIGLGPLHKWSLAEARKLADAMRKAAADGGDPAGVLRPARDEVQPKTFAECARELIEAKRPGWRNPKHAQQWANTLRDYAFPVIGNKPPAEVTLADIKAILLPLWATKTETATRVRQRIEAVLDYAAVHGLCDAAANPARWKGRLDKVLPAPRKVASREHFASAPYTDVPRILAELAGRGGMPALHHPDGLPIRRGARCDLGRDRFRDGDVDDPGKAHEGGKSHRVPLSGEAMAVLRAAWQWRIEGCDLVFPGQRGGMLSDVVVSKALHAVAPGVSVHGMRAAFRTWAEEQTSFPRSVTEATLAHVNADRVEAAYQRSDLFARRRELMRAWANHCAGAGGNVMPMRRGMRAA